MGRKGIVYTFIMLLLLTFLFTNRWMEITYSKNIFEYFRKSQALTAEEKQWLREKGSLIFTADYATPPLYYIDKEDQQYKGLVIDYIHALSKELQTEIILIPKSHQESLNLLSKGMTTDISIVYPTVARGSDYFFSYPIYHLQGVIVVSKDENIIGHYKDLENRRIALSSYDYALEFLQKKLSSADYIFTADTEEALKLLEIGEVDAVVGDDPVISYYIRNLNIGEKVKTLNNPIYEKEWALAVPKSNEILISILNKAIHNLEMEKITSSLHRTWFGIATPVFKENISDRISLIILVFTMAISLVFYFFYVTNKLLRVEIEKKMDELHISKNDLQTTFDGLMDFMIVTNQKGNILNVNKSLCRLLDIHKSEIVGKHFEDISDLVLLSCNQSLINTTFDEGKSLRKEFQQNGNIYEISTFPLEDQKKRIPKILIIIKDITKARLSEQQLLQENKMATIGQLAAAVTHEIRNPLGLIRNYCYLLKNSKPLEEHKMKKAVTVIESSIEKSNHIINSLLDFSRMSNNKWEKVDLKDFIHSIIALQQNKIKQQQIEVTIECKENNVYFVNVSSLEIILMNLIANAIDAMIDGGRLILQCGQQNNVLTIKCIDTGIGIEKEHLKKLFSPFFTTKPRGKGTGLGLYITYNEVQKLEGKIYVHSEIKKGTTFDILLPLKEVI